MNNLLPLMSESEHIAWMNDESCKHCLDYFDCAECEAPIPAGEQAREVRKAMEEENE